MTRALFGPLTPYVETMLRRRIIKYVSWKATYISDTNMFLVNDSHTRFTVDSEYNSCTCGKWQHNPIPCGQVIMVFRCHNMLSYCSMNYRDYATSTAFQHVYRTWMAHHVPPQDQWEIPINLMIVLPSYV